MQVILYLDNHESPLKGGDSFFLDMASLIANSVNLPTKYSEFTNQIQ